MPAAGMPDRSIPLVQLSMATLVSLMAPGAVSLHPIDVTINQDHEIKLR